MLGNVCEDRTPLLPGPLQLLLQVLHPLFALPLLPPTLLQLFLQVVYLLLEFAAPNSFITVFTVLWRKPDLSQSHSS